MITVQRIGATAAPQAPADAEEAMSPWSVPVPTMAAMRPLNSSSTLYPAKRKRDCWEAYDYQVHMRQQMRYSMLQEQPQCYQQQYYQSPPSAQQPQQPMTYPRRVSLENLPCLEEQAAKRQRLNGDNDQQLVERRDPVATTTHTTTTTTHTTPLCSSHQVVSQNTRVEEDDARRAARRLHRKSHCSSSSHKRAHRSANECSSSSRRRQRVARMTRKHYSKKKRMEMMDATQKQIQAILNAATAASTVVHHRLPIRAVQRVKYYRYKAAQLDSHLRNDCNAIVHKEQDIKAWLGMTTRNKDKIISLRKRMYDRWMEVKDLQTDVKPKRQRLKNLKFAVLCEERSIEEEEDVEVSEMV